MFLLLFTIYLKFWKNIIFKAGARVTVHDTSLRPLVDEDAQDVTPGQSTQIALQEASIVYWTS